MIDPRRLEIERLFDGELDEAARAELLGGLADDPEARAHLGRLARLRELARRHDPASRPARRAAPGWWASSLATAAGIALIAWSPLGSPPARMVEKSPRLVRPTGSPVRPTAEWRERLVEVHPFEVELYGWANAPSRRPGEAARLVLAPASTNRKRTSADEILALELANAPSGAGGSLRRIAVSRGPRPSAPGRSVPPNPRPQPPLRSA